MAADSARILGPEHPDTLTAQANLAVSYGQAGPITGEAITIQEKVAAAPARILGPEHPDTLDAQANLASSYGQAGPDQGGDHHRGAGGRRPGADPGPEHPGHPDRAGQPRLLLSAGRAGPGRRSPFRRRSTADRARILGPEHPDTLRRAGQPRRLLRQAGPDREAITIGEKVTADSARIRGPEHPDTLTAQANLATFYRQAGRTGKRSALRRRR